MQQHISATGITIVKPWTLPFNLLSTCFSGRHRLKPRAAQRWCAAMLEAWMREGAQAGWLANGRSGRAGTPIAMSLKRVHNPQRSAYMQVWCTHGHGLNSICVELQ